MLRLLIFTLSCACFLQPVAAADPDKTLRIAFAVAETAFDPVIVSDLYSNIILEGIIEPMLSYDYLARPVKLMPNTLEAMPEVSDNGAAYEFHIRKGIYFTPDPAFKGVRRELTAADYAYSIRRLFDPKLRSPWLFLLEGKIIGADAVMQRAKARNAGFDYDAPIEGLEVTDRYTLRIRLNEPDYNLLYIMAMPTLAALAREVVDYYGADIGSHPVGTGPFVPTRWVRSSKIVLEANPQYRDVFFASAGGPDPASKGIAAQLKGKKLPLAGRVEVSIIEEAQPRYLAFLNGDLDYLGVPNEFANLVMREGKLAPNLAKKGITLSRFAEPDVTYTYFNMDDKVVGGYSREKIALRRAISLAYDTDAEIRILRRNQAMAAQTPIPPGVAGYDPAFGSPFSEYNPAKAKALLDLFGYTDRDGDGYRELPDGEPLTIEYASTNNVVDRQFDELWKRCMDAIGIRMTFKKAKWPDLLKQSKLGKLQMKGSAWTADYPDGDNFLQLLYGPNAGQANDARFRLREYDELYRKAKRMPDSPERTRLYDEMTGYMLVYAPWRLGVHRVASTLVQPWIVGYRDHPIIHAPWKYLDIDLPRRGAGR
jgi:peptide/nickel transport system substrate-binding protein